MLARRSRPYTGKARQIDRTCRTQYIAQVRPAFILQTLRD